MRSLAIIGTCCLFLFIATSPLRASVTPNPAIDIEKAWRSLQTIAGTWSADNQNQVKWRQTGQTRLKKVVFEAGGERTIGQLIRKKDTIIYELKKEDQIVSLELKEASPSMWVFTTETDALLRSVQLSLINGEVLKNEIVAESPSGRRFSIQSEMNRQ